MSDKEQFGGNLLANPDYDQTEYPSIGEVSKEYTEEERQELMASLKETGKTDRIVVTNSINTATGIKATKVLDGSKYDSISDIFNERDRKGKCLNWQGVKILDDILGLTDLEDATIKRVEELLSTMNKLDDAESLSIDELKDAYRGEVLDKMTNQFKFRPGNELETKLILITKQLFKHYTWIIKEVDYLSINEKVHNMIHVYDEDTETTGSIKNPTYYRDEFEDYLDSNRGNLSQSDYNYVAMLLRCHDDSIAHTSLFEYVEKNSNQLKKELRKDKKVKEKVCTWVKDIDTDETFTFAVPLTGNIDDKSKTILFDLLFEFIYYQLLTCEMTKYNIDLNVTFATSDDIIKYYKKKGWLSGSLNRELKKKTTVYLYTLAKRFKRKKWYESEKEALLFALMIDLMSKSNFKEYNAILYKHVTHIYELVYGDSFIKW